MRLIFTVTLFFICVIAFPQNSNTNVNYPEYKEKVAFIEPYVENYKLRPALEGERTIRDYFHFDHFDFKKGSFVDNFTFDIDSFMNMNCGSWIHKYLEETCTGKLNPTYFQIDDSTYKCFYLEMSGMVYTIKNSHLSQKEICNLKISNYICHNLRKSGYRYLMAYMYKFYNKFPDRKTSSFLVLDLNTGHPVYYKSSTLNTKTTFSESPIKRHTNLKRVNFAFSDKRKFGYDVSPLETPNEQILYYDVIRLTKNFLNKIKKPQ